VKSDRNEHKSFSAQVGCRVHGCRLKWPRIEAFLIRIERGISDVSGETGSGLGKEGHDIPQSSHKAMMITIILDGSDQSVIKRFYKFIRLITVMMKQEQYGRCSYEVAPHLK
jgi:hypothetical protein